MVTLFCLSCWYNKKLVTLLLGESEVALFPGHSHLQWLILCSMQIQRGKAWEIWLHTVTVDGVYTHRWWFTTITTNSWMCMVWRNMLLNSSIKWYLSNHPVLAIGSEDCLGTGEDECPSHAKNSICFHRPPPTITAAENYEGCPSNVICQISRLDSVEFLRCCSSQGPLSAVHTARHTHLHKSFWQ